jgi:HTH-type transcriptional regulator / antitoxin HigA
MTTPRVYSYEPDLVLPPGDTLAEVLDDAGMTQAELAKRTGLSTKHVNQIVNGAASITPETALLLERATGIRARVWSNLEVAYREHLSRQEESATLLADIGWLELLPLRDLIKRGWVEAAQDPVRRVRSVCQFFGVANRSAWEAVWEKPTAYRTSRAFKSDPGAVAAWLRIGEIKAAEIDCAPYDRSGLTALLAELRRLTSETDPDIWYTALVQLCAGVGVTVVLEPEIKGARINGAARWLSPDKALVQLSLRHKWNDIFWFTFFHEVGHLLMHSKKDTFLNDVGVHSGVEEEADGFAGQLLIPRHFEAELAEVHSLDDARALAAELDVAPGIVVGRLQHDKRWPYNRGNDLKQRFTLEDA